MPLVCRPVHGAFFEKEDAAWDLVSNFSALQGALELANLASVKLIPMEKVESSQGIGIPTLAALTD